MKEAISREKDGHKAMCRNSTEENKRRCLHIALCPFFSLDIASFTFRFHHHEFYYYFILLLEANYFIK